MSHSIQLLTIIGSPYVEPKEPRINKTTLNILYRLSTKNKVGLYYLTKLKEMGLLQGFEEDYNYEENRYETFLSTLTRLFDALERLEVKCAAFKTLSPFPVNLNDVDLLNMETNLTHHLIANALSKKGYDIYAQAHQSISIHDKRDGPHTDPDIKDPYDIDIYEEISADWVIYLDKNKLKKFLIKKKVNGTNIQTFSLEAELPIVLTHSVFPEQLYTLYHYYSTLYYLHHMKNWQLSLLSMVVRECHICVPVRASLMLTAQIHMAAHGWVPESLIYLLSKLGVNEIPPSNSSLETPIRFDIHTVAATLVEKMIERKTATSILKETVSMLDPRAAKYIAWHLVFRRRRETY